jgi:hypothetical protein
MDIACGFGDEFGVRIDIAASSTRPLTLTLSREGRGDKTRGVRWI